MCGCLVFSLADLTLEFFFDTFFSKLGFVFSNEHICVVQDKYVEEGRQELL